MYYNVYVSAFRHVDKVYLLTASVSCFYCLKICFQWSETCQNNSANRKAFCGGMQRKTLRAGVPYICTYFGLKTAVFGCLTNALATSPIALESCSRAETDRPV